MNIIRFENETKLPAYLTTSSENTDDLSSGIGQGFPVISIKGKVFHLVRGDERTLLTKPGSDDPTSSIEVVILKANRHLSKVFYEKGYEEGSTEKPTCYSNDGVSPAKDAAVPQARTCASCVHNQWGSRVTENGQKLKACSDYRRLAIAAPGALEDPMLLRVPAASLKALSQFGDLLKKRGVKNYSAVVVRIGFDYSVAHPALTFKPVGFLPEAEATKALSIANSELVNQIVGIANAPEDIETVPPADEFSSVSNVTSTAEQPVRNEPAVAAKTKPVVERPVQNETATKTTKTGKTKVAPLVVDSLDKEIDAVLEELDLDD